MIKDAVLYMITRGWQPIVITKVWQTGRIKKGYKPSMI